MQRAFLSDEQEMIVEVADRITEKNFADNAFTWHEETPWENLQLLADQGFYCMAIPEQYGGGGMSVFEDMLLIETVGKTCPDTGWEVLFSTVAPHTVVQFGTEEAKETYLPPVCNGEALIAIAISEPEAGSDVSKMNTTLRKRATSTI